MGAGQKLPSRPLFTDHFLTCDTSDLLTHLPADRTTLNEMLPGIYEELQCLADYYLSRERPDHRVSFERSVALGVKSRIK